MEQEKAPVPQQDDPTVESKVETKQALHSYNDPEIQAGHLEELEVDLARVLAADHEVEGDWDADTSPFAEVRAVVPETDDPDMPVNTLRAWLLGIVRKLLLSAKYMADRCYYRSSCLLVLVLTSSSLCATLEFTSSPSSRNF
jgi:hypothetical protein